MDVSIIIINYNTKDLTLNCINSITSKTFSLTYELIIVDNASIDGSQALLRREYPDIILIESERNLGFGRANNLGAVKAQGKYLFFLNSDTVLLNDSIYQLFQFNELKKSKLRIGICGGVLIDKNGSETGSFGPLPNMTNTLKSIVGIYPRFTRMTSAETTFYHENHFLEVGYIMGADMFIEKSIFDTIGGFDPNLFMYYEETDLQFRLKKANYHNYLISGPKIVHFEGGCTPKTYANNFKRLVITKSMFYYFRKHSGYFNYLLFKIVYFLIRLTTIFYPSYSWKEKKEYFLQILKS